MASGGDSSSDSDFIPGASDSEASSEFSDDSDWEVEHEPHDPLSEDGWEVLINYEDDFRPDAIPDFTAGCGASGEIRHEVPNFTSPVEAFLYFFDGELVDSLVMWMNERASEYFSETGKKK